MKGVGVSKRTTIIVTLLLTAGIIVGLTVFNTRDTSCDPQAATGMLDDLKQHGILRVQHPPSLSNLLWVHVGPTWHALTFEEKKSLDRTVRCLALTKDDKGQTTWRAAYYNDATGKLAALTSKQYGFRLP